MRTVLSEEEVARRGVLGWGAVCQARAGEGEGRVERRVRVPWGRVVGVGMTAVDVRGVGRWGI